MLKRAKQSASSCEGKLAAPVRLLALNLIDGPMDTATFLQYVEQILIPTLKPSDLVICNNLSCSKSPAVKEALQKAGADIKYLPPYRPDMNPIEMAFSKLKEFLEASSPESFQKIV
ncbi:transposase [Coraliomargarita sp. W4R53]